ncbi:MAG: hypothetical protein LIO65_07550 [Odoribacter sp.]|nr:hypothetical protein [Odoribacter sp.]
MGPAIKNEKVVGVRDSVLYFTDSIGQITNVLAVIPPTVSLLGNNEMNV